MGEKFKPKEQENRPSDIERARERKNLIALEKGRIKEQLLDLSEEETKKVGDLMLFGEEEFKRATFVENEEKHLHASDKVDDIVNWLNRGRKEKLEELKMSGITPQILREDLLSISEKFFILAGELNNLKKIKLNLSAWKQEYERLIEDLYNAIQRNIGKVGEVKEGAAGLAGDIRGKRIDLVTAIRESFGIGDEEWMNYVNEHV